MADSAPLIKSTPAWEDQTWWRVTHAGAFILGGVTFWIGTWLYYDPADSLGDLDQAQISAWLYIIGSIGFLYVDVEEFFTFTDEYWLRVNIACSVTGSTLVRERANPLSLYARSHFRLWPRARSPPLPPVHHRLGWLPALRVRLVAARRNPRLHPRQLLHRQLADLEGHAHREQRGRRLRERRRAGGDVRRGRRVRRRVGLLLRHHRVLDRRG